MTESKRVKELKAALLFAVIVIVLLGITLLFNYFQLHQYELIQSTEYFTRKQCEQMYSIIPNFIPQ
jgi:hypothetical protein